MASRPHAQQRPAHPRKGPLWAHGYRRVMAGGLVWLLVGCFWLSQGCTATTARLAGWYLTRKIDSYLDLTGDQKSWVRDQVDRELDVARRRDLPRWLYLGRQLRDTIDQGATDAKLGQLQKRYDRLMDDAVNTLAPHMGATFAKLSDEQIDHFEETMLETLHEYYEEQDLPPKERREELDEKLLEGIESLADDLRPEQERKILAAVHALPSERHIQYRVGKQRIHSSAQFLRTHPGAAAIEAEIHRLWETRYEVLGPGRGKQARRAEQRAFLLTIDSTMSRAQRDHAVKEINASLRKGQRFVLPPKK